MIKRTHFAAACVCLVAATWQADGLAYDQTAQGALLRLNQIARDAYAETRSVMLAATSPYIIVSFDDVILVRDGVRDVVPYTPQVYHDLKSIAHLSLGIYGAALSYLERYDTERWRAVFSDLTEVAGQVRAEVDAYGFSPESADRQRRILDTSIGFLERSLADSGPTAAGLDDYIDVVMPWFMANVTEAARAQLDGLHAAVMRWQVQLSEEELERLYVLVLGPRMPRQDNLAYQYFEEWLGADERERRLVYAENIFTEGGAESLLGVLRIDRHLSLAFFDDPMRMDRDLLGDAAQHYVLDLFGRLGE